MARKTTCVRVLSHDHAQGPNSKPAPAPIPASSQAASIANPTQLSLSQVLHYLQSEFRKYERERNEWEIERGEMRARIALLEGERRGHENARSDLLRRVRMLEFALKGERSKYLSLTQNQTAGGLPQTNTQKTTKDERPSSPSSSASSSVAASVDDKDARPVQISITPAQTQQASAIPSHLAQRSSSSLSNGAPSDRADAKTSTSDKGNNNAPFAGGPNTWNPAIGRDPRGRARSRDYLRQCLQEISYLTNATTLNPLPDTSATGIPRPRRIMVQLPQGPNVTTAPSGPIEPSPLPPAVSLSSQAQTHTNASLPLPSTSSAASSQPQTTFGGPGFNFSSYAKARAADAGLSAESIPPAPLAEMLPSTSQGPLEPFATVSSSVPTSSSTTSNTSAFASPNWPNGILPPLPAATPSQPPPTPTSPLKDLPFDGPSVSGPVSVPMEASSQDGDAADRLTAIFRPKSGSVNWRDHLKEMNDKTNGSKANPTTSLSTDVEALSEKALEELGSPPPSEKDEDESSSAAVDDERAWKSRKTLRSHLDGVRTLAFGKGPDLALVTAGDDATVKVWRLNPHTLGAAGPRAQASPEIEPQVTLRAHTGPITCVAVSPGQDRIYSGSLDQTVQVWSMPPRDRETYAPVDTSLRLARLEGHTDAIWDLAVLPLRIQDESLLATASADGTVKLWSTGDLSSPLKLSWRYNGLGTDEEGAHGQTNGTTAYPSPTAVSVCYADLKKLAVAYQNAVVKLFDVETGKEVLKFKSDESYDGTTATQINAVAAHPTLPILVTAHEDRYIRIFDTNTGECTHSTLAHQDAVTSVDIDGAGLNFVTAGHDCSIRFWDLLSTRTCVQEVASHRPKGSEGILDVQYHPSLPYVASAGADSLVKIYSYPV